MNSCNLAYIQRMLGYDENEMAAEEKVTLAKDRCAWRKLVMVCLLCSRKDDDYDDRTDFGNLLYKIPLFIMNQNGLLKQKISYDEVVFSGRI